MSFVMSQTPANRAMDLQSALFERETGYICVYVNMPLLVGSVYPTRNMTPGFLQPQPGQRNRGMSHVWSRSVFQSF